MSEPPVQFLAIPGEGIPINIAYRSRAAGGDGPPRPGIVWLGGFMSDMESTKAQAIDAHAAAQGGAFLRFDYSGHGRSQGRFEDGTIGQWAAQSLAVLRQLTAGPQILIGSSMGAWIALLVARALARLSEESRIAGMVLVAPAVDFTEKLMWARLPPDVRRQIEVEGLWHRPSDYSATPYPITRALIEDGRKNCLLDAPVRSYGPVHILQGMADPDVPWQHAMRLVECLATDPVVVTLVKGAGHRLSGPEDLARMLAAIDGVARECAPIAPPN